jgi:hypothetical protein
MRHEPQPAGRRRTRWIWTGVGVVVMVVVAVISVSLVLAGIAIVQFTNGLSHLGERLPVRGPDAHRGRLLPDQRADLRCPLRCPGSRRSVVERTAASRREPQAARTFHRGERTALSGSDPRAARRDSETRCTRVVSNSALARDGTDLTYRTGPILKSGQQSFGYASDLVGNQCAVGLAADSSTLLSPFVTTTTVASSRRT